MWVTPQVFHCQGNTSLQANSLPGGGAQVAPAHAPHSPRNAGSLNRQMPNLKQTPSSKWPSSKPSPPPSRLTLNDTKVTGISYQNVGKGARQAATRGLKSTIYCGRRRADHNIPSLAGLAPFSPVGRTQSLVVRSHGTPNIMHSRHSRHCRRHTQGWVFSHRKPTSDSPRSRPDGPPSGRTLRALFCCSRARWSLNIEYWILDFSPPRTRPRRRPQTLPALPSAGSSGPLVP